MRRGACQQRFAYAGRSSRCGIPGLAVRRVLLSCALLLGAAVLGCRRPPRAPRHAARLPRRPEGERPTAASTAARWSPARCGASCSAGSSQEARVAVYHLHPVTAGTPRCAGADVQDRQALARCRRGSAGATSASAPWAASTASSSTAPACTSSRSARARQAPRLPYTPAGRRYSFNGKHFRSLPAGDRHAEVGRG